MGSVSSHFLERPGTRLGWWSVGLGALFTLLFVAILNEWLVFSGVLTMLLGLIAAILTLIAVYVKGERSWLVCLMLLPGAFVIYVVLIGIIYPH